MHLRATALLLLAAVCVASASHVIVLDDGSYDEETSKGIWMVEFYAPWCGHCKALAPVYEDAATRLADKPLHFAKIDATENPMLTARYEIKGYPRVMYIVDGSEAVLYRGKRDVAGFTDFARRMLSAAVHSVKTVEEMLALLGFNDVVYVLGFEQGGGAASKAVFEGFSNVAAEKRALLTLAASSSKAVLDSFKAPQTPFIAKVQAGEPPQFFSLPAAAALEAELGAWVEAEKFPLLTRLYEMNFKDFSSQEGKLTAIAVLDPSSETKSDRLKETMRKFARPGGSPLSAEARAAYSFGFLDGVKWEKFLKQYSVYPEMLPHVFVIDGPNSQFYQDSDVDVADAAAFLSAVAAGEVMAQTEGMLGMWHPTQILWQARHYPQPLVYGAFAVVFAAAIGFVVFILKAICEEDEDIKTD